ncbi:hypothetical protein DL991_10165 [Amycolatopsis sp. WAC 01375]|uniref:hypothetical protein n=1 Tax=Amycolatopsis sp. WAC 01375 TaxID=2203194 RepID=UPI000F78C4B6|nr:hypothetical protein [Amycolatopsis sp. WAC 01375]RSM80484.1 hypothetical protein DL991_10165 [Amycolatopsis sp. WAC 01375]
MIWQMVTNGSELRGWLLLTVRGEYKQLVTVIDAVLTARVEPGHPARKRGNTSPITAPDAAAHTWEDSIVYLALCRLLNWAQRPHETA